MSTAEAETAWRWAWAQRIPVEEKLLLLSLVDGEAEPNLDELAARTGLGGRSIGIAAEQLHRRGLIDDDLHPTLKAADHD